MQCQGCQKYILAVVAVPIDTDKHIYLEHYPTSAPNYAVADEIPDHIKPDFKEALRCLSVDAYNATVEMCRRALEAICIDLGIPKGIKVLEDMIDSLEEQRKITPHIKQVAHKIRLGGNRAAHPPEDGVTEAMDTATQAGDLEVARPVILIEKEHAEAIVEFTRHFFHHVYVVPRQLDKYDFSKPKVSKAD